MAVGMESIRDSRFTSISLKLAKEEITEEICVCRSSILGWEVTAYGPLGQEQHVWPGVGAGDGGAGLEEERRLLIISSWTKDSIEFPINWGGGWV